MTKYVFVTGGVVSGLGKGITAASLGRLLKARGLKVAAQKLDPYINVDPGTMSPYQHGEVYVTEDGAETDLDLGHYERFIDEDLNRFSNLTTGKVYWNVLNKERAGEYLGENVIGDFEKQFGVRVIVENFDSNEMMYTKLMAGDRYDVIIPSDYMIEYFIKNDMLAELDFSNIPEYKNIDEKYRGLHYDPENKYTVPYTWGSVGIIYNTTMVDEPITSWGAMFDEKYAGQVLMINNSRDALMAALCYLGYDINTTDEGQLTEAFELVKNAKDKGVYQAFVMDEVFGKMEGGNAAITMYYAGDYLTMLENNEDLAFVIPEEGSNWFVDAMCVLKSSQHKAEAYEWINFIASTDSNLANMDYIWYASPNAEALAEYPAYYEEQYGEPLDEEIYNIMAIPDEERERCEIYVNLPQETLKFYDKLWTQLGV